MRAAAAWFGLMLVVAVAGSVAAYHVAAASDYFRDPLGLYDAAYGFTLPVHLIQAAYPGWPILAVLWLMLALFGFAGWRLAQALAKAGASVALVLWGYGLIALVLTFCAIVQSVDVYYYVAFGRIYGLHGLNPYFLKTPIDVSGDPSLSQALGYLKNPPFNDPYGPLWTLMAGLVGKLSAGLSLYWQVWLYRALTVIAGLATLAAIAYALRARPNKFDRSNNVSGERTWRVARVAFHPLFLYETAVGGHNEMLRVAPAVWAFAIVDELPLIAALLMGASIAVKYMSVVALPFLLWRAFSRSRSAGLIGLVISLAIPMLCFKPFWVGGGSLGATAMHANSLGMSLTWLLTMPLFKAGLGSTLWPRAVQLALVGVFLIVALVSFIRFVRDERYANVWRTITAFFWASPIIHPWYLLMLTPAVAGGGRWAIYAWWFCALIPLRYALDGVSGAPVGALIALTLIILAVPVVMARWLPAWEPAAGSRGPQALP